MTDRNRGFCVGAWQSVSCGLLAIIAARVTGWNVFALIALCEASCFIGVAATWWLVGKGIDDVKERHAP